MVNFVKMRPVKSLMFALLCFSFIAPYRCLVAVPWQSFRPCVLAAGGTMLLTNEKCVDAKLLSSDEWCARLAYLADKSQNLNDLDPKNARPT